MIETPTEMYINPVATKYYTSTLQTHNKIVIQFASTLQQLVKFI